MQARGGAVREDRGHPRETEKARESGEGAGGWLGGRGGVELVMDGDGEVVRPLK